MHNRRMIYSNWELANILRTSLTNLTSSQLAGFHLIQWLSFLPEERKALILEEVIMTVEETYAAINTAIDDTTNAVADEIQRASDAIAQAVKDQAIPSTLPVPPDPNNPDNPNSPANLQANQTAQNLVDRLQALSQKLRATDFASILQNDENLQKATGITPTGATIQSGTTPAGNSEAAGTPENTQGNVSSSTTDTGSAGNISAPTPQIGVSDSDNPTSSSSPAPLGSPVPVPATNKLPTDAVVEQVTGTNPADNQPTTTTTTTPDNSQTTPQNPSQSSGTVQDDNNPAIPGNTANANSSDSSGSNATNATNGNPGVVPPVLNNDLTNNQDKDPAESPAESSTGTQNPNLVNSFPESGDSSGENNAGAGNSGANSSSTGAGSGQTLSNGSESEAIPAGNNSTNPAPSTNPSDPFAPRS